MDMNMDTNEVAALRAWMEAHAYTIRQLADRMGISYDGVYQALKVRESCSPEFKWRFAEAFGWEEAERVFGVERTSQPDRQTALQ